MTLEVRAYNVLFGDCVLVSWDEDDGKHHAWVDFGNHPGDNNGPFAPVYDDVLRRTDGHVDLAIVTHRHMDHLEGFFSLRHRFAADFQIDRLWHAHVSAGLDGNFEAAGKQVREMASTTALLGTSPLATTYRNNYGELAAGLTTKDRMNAIRNELPIDSEHEVHRQLDLGTTGARPPGMSHMAVEVLAPEANSATYLTDEVHPLAAAASTATTGVGSHEIFPRRWRPQPAMRSDLIRVADFARLRRRIRSDAAEILAAADKTRNNTSVVTRWTYHGVTLLLTGDAEERSWEVMKEVGVDLSADLVKVAHHGSIDASPDWAFTAVFPTKRSRNRVLISTDPTRYDEGPNEVPKAEVLAGWRGRVTRSSRLKRSDDRDPTGSVAFRFLVGP